MQKCAFLIAIFLVQYLAPRVSYAKTPSWLADEHPRLLATSSEKAAITTKLTTPNTLSAAVWTQVLSNYRRAGNNFDFADGAVVYWITGNTAAADAAITNATNFMNQYPGGLAPPTSLNLPDYPVEWWRYHNLLFTYDFAYTRLTPTQKIQFRDYIAREAELCTTIGPSWAPGNIHMAFALCALGSAIVLEGNDASRDIQNEAVVRGAPANGQDRLYWQDDISNLVVSSQPNGGGTLYRSGVDYNWVWCGNGRCVDWSPTTNGAVEPAASSTYYASYHWSANTDRWKNEGRRAFENHLSYAWRDGSYNGGLDPYGNLMAAYIPYFVEMAKRDYGVDYSHNQDLKKIVDPYIYERLPPSGIINRRWNSINDSSGLQDNTNAMTYPGGTTYRAWMRPFVSWATKAFAWDPEGYAQRSYWVWTQYYRGSDGQVWFNPDPDWREAFWFNDALLGNYPNPAIPAVTWPKHRYFRGKEMVYTRSSFDYTDSKALVASFLAGPHNYQNEHDQGDSGSFTFFYGGEDWAVDTGYGGYSLLDHNGLGIDGHGFATSGAYDAVPAGYTSPDFGGFSHFDSVVLTDGGSALKAELTGAWSLNSTPYLDHDERYFAVVTGNETPYMIVADDIQKDSSNHSFEWYLHTRETNTISPSANGATIRGQSGATMQVRALNPASVTASVATISDGNLLNHPRLILSASGVQNPNFLNVLLPTASGGTPPVVARSALANGIKGTVTWPDGAVDTILWRTGSGIITDGSFVSDAKLTVLRKSGGAATGVLFIDGRTVSENGTFIAKAVDGSNPISLAAFGSTMGVAAKDSSMIRVRIPGISAATLEDGAATIPVSSQNGVTAINAPLSLSEMRRGSGVRYFDNFDDNYPDYFYRVNLEKGNSEKFTVKNGALELVQSTYLEYVTQTRRDSTVWRRENIFPTIIPPLDHADATVSFKFRFSSLSDLNRSLRLYLRSQYRDRADWALNQDYVRVELSASENGSVKNQVKLGQRVNGDLTGPELNDTLTNSVASSAASINDMNWHAVSVYMKGGKVKISIDGSQLIDANLSVPAPTAPASGFLQWRVIGADPVLIDDLKVEAVDTWAPAPPSSGTLNINQSGAGSLTLQYVDGMSPDAAFISFYESSAPISSTTDPATLVKLGTSNQLSSMNISGANGSRFHAVSVTDQSGNESLLLPLGDAIAPNAPTNVAVH